MSSQQEYSILASFKVQNLSQFERALDTAKTKYSQLPPQLQGIKQKFDELGSKLQKFKTDIDKASQSVDKSNQSLEQQKSKLSSLGSALQTHLTSISTLSLSIVNFSRSYRDLEDSQIAVDRATRKLSVAQDEENRRRNQVNKLVKEGKTDTQEYKQALLDLNQAEQQVSIATQMRGEALESQSDQYQNFYMSILPTALSSLAVLGGSLSAITNRTKTAGDSVTTAGGKFSRFAGLLRGGLGLAAVAGTFLAIRNNTFGIRDALDNLGLTIGNHFPQLKGFLTWVRDLGAALGLTGGDVDFSKAWDLLKSGFTSAIEAIKATDWKAILITIGTSIETAINEFDWDSAWQSFRDALGSTGEWVGIQMKNVGAAIIKYISDNADDWWLNFLNGLNWTWQQIETQLKNTFTIDNLKNFGSYVWNAIVTGFGNLWDYVTGAKPKTDLVTPETKINTTEKPPVRLDYNQIYEDLVNNPPSGVTIPAPKIQNIEFNTNDIKNNTITKKENLETSKQLQKAWDSVLKLFGVGKKEIDNTTNTINANSISVKRNINDIVGLNDILKKGTAERQNYDDRLNFIMQRRETLSKTSLDTLNQLRAQAMSIPTIDTSKLFALRNADESYDQINNTIKIIEQLIVATGEVPVTWAEMVAESERATQEMQQQWQTFFDEYDSLFRNKDLSKRLKEMGFDKDARKDIKEAFDFRIDSQDIFKNLADSLKIFDFQKIDKSSMKKWSKNMMSDLQEQIKDATPKGKAILQPIYDVIKENKDSPEGMKAALSALFEKDPKILQGLKDMGVDIDAIMSSLGMTGAESFNTSWGTNFDPMKNMTFDKETGKGKVTGNPFTPLITTIHTSFTQLSTSVSEILAGIANFEMPTFTFPSPDLRQLTKGFASAISSAEGTKETILKSLQMKFPNIDLRNYTKSLATAISSAETTRKEIIKALASKISIKVGFDVAKLPSFGVSSSGGSAKITLKGAAKGFHGWVTDPTMFLTREAGEDEYVDITPKSQMGNRRIMNDGNNNNTSQGRPIIHIHNHNKFVIDGSRLINRIELDKTVQTILDSELASEL